MVEQPFGHIERGDMLRFVAQTVEHEFMFADTLNRKQIVVFQALLHIVGIEGGQRPHIHQTLRTERHNVAQRTRLNRKITESC